MELNYKQWLIRHNCPLCGLYDNTYHLSTCNKLLINNVETRSLTNAGNNSYATWLY